MILEVWSMQDPYHTQDFMSSLLTSSRALLLDRVPPLARAGTVAEPRREKIENVEFGVLACNLRVYKALLFTFLIIFRVSSGYFLSLYRNLQ